MKSSWGGSDGTAGRSFLHFRIHAHVLKNCVQLAVIATIVCVRNKRVMDSLMELTKWQTERRPHSAYSRQGMQDHVHGFQSGVG